MDEMCEVDFHTLPAGISPDEVIVLTREVIEQARADKVRSMRIIVGKGLGSPYGPVIRPAVKTCLGELVEQGGVKKFFYETLPSGMVNEGAIIITIF
jgi:DNA-nicking Smr family endonuclease